MAPLILCLLLPAFPFEATAGARWTMRCSDGTYTHGDGFAWSIDASAGSGCTLVVEFEVPDQTGPSLGEPPSHAAPPSSGEEDERVATRRWETFPMEEVPTEGSILPFQSHAVNMSNQQSLISCEDPLAPFASLTLLLPVWGVECSDILVFSSIFFPPFFAGGIPAACHASIEAWVAAATQQMIPLRLSPSSFSSPIPVTEPLSELCPTTCAAAGVHAGSCSSPPPTFPKPEGRPSLLTLPLTTNGSIRVETEMELRAALDAGAAGDVHVHIPAGTVIFLGGRALVIDGANVTLSSDGGGAVLDGEHLSRIITVLPGVAYPSPFFPSTPPPPCPLHSCPHPAPPPRPLPLPLPQPFPLSLAPLPLFLFQLKPISLSVSIAITQGMC